MERGEREKERMRGRKGEREAGRNDGRRDREKDRNRKRDREGGGGELKSIRMREKGREWCVFLERKGGGS